MSRLCCFWGEWEFFLWKTVPVWLMRLPIIYYYYIFSLEKESDIIFCENQKETSSTVCLKMTHAMHTNQWYTDLALWQVSLTVCVCLCVLVFECTSWCMVREVEGEMEEEVRKTAAAKVRRTKCHRDPGLGHRNSGTSDLYFTCRPASHIQSSAITT